MSELLKILILGIVEGFTEFLPISSTGHLIAAVAILDFRQTFGGTFEIFIQFGAVVAVVLYYRRELFYQVSHVLRDPKVQRFWLSGLIAAIPAGLVGVLFGDKIKAALFSPAVVAVALIAGGIALIIIERSGRITETADETPDDVMRVTPRQALIVGLVQLFAFIPGMSRSGSTIVGGMLSGLNRRVATQFSFFLAIPVLGSATLYDLWQNRDLVSGDGLITLLLGALVSGIVAWWSLAWLLRFVARNNFIPFGYYRILAGIALLVLIAAGLM